jgi:hypothetical protein
MSHAVRLRLVLALVLLSPLDIVWAQDFPDSIDGFDFDNISFDDDLFGTDENSTPAWLEPFTFKISQQLFAQINSHTVTRADQVAESRNAAMENNRLSVLTRYQNAFAPGWLLQASAQTKVYWRGDYEYRANDERIDTEFRLNEFFVQRSTGDNSVKLGAQTVVWGENIGNSVLDVINTSEFRDLTIIDIEDARLNQWLLVWDRFVGNHQLSSFVNLYPEFNPPPVRGSPFFFEPAFNLTDYQRDKPLFEIGSQMRWSVAGSDISLMGAYLYENQLFYSAPPSGVGDALSEANDYLLLGISANRAVGKLLLNLDLAYSHDILTNVLVSPEAVGESNYLRMKAMNKLGATLGFEYAIDNDQNIILGVSAESIVASQNQLTTNEALLGDEVTGNALLRYSNNMRNGDLQLAVTVQSALDAGSVLGSVSLNYTLSNKLAVMGQVIATSAARDSALATLDEDLRAGLTLSWTF